MKKAVRTIMLGLLVGSLLVLTACGAAGSGKKAGKAIPETEQSDSKKQAEKTENSKAAAKTEAEQTKEKSADKKVVYTTFFPVYDLAKRIIGDRMEVKLIIRGNQEPHDFELPAGDMAKICQADLILYNGAGMESFIPDLKQMAGSAEKFLDLSQGLTLLESGTSDGLQQEGENRVVNPHTWLSIKNALIQLDTIYQKLSSIDPDYEAEYRRNLEKAQAEFTALEQKFAESLAKVKQADKYFVVSHAAFNYLAADYGLKQVAVTGISPEDEPTAKQLKKIADFVKEHQIKTIFFEGKATPKVAETLAANTGTKTDTLYTMESLTEDEVKMGYLKLMEKNLEALVKSFEE
ncbi:MAG: zinc ABC transporter substrate-binding protein [Lachnospiraceae bacterium]|nr:zinc ABC transporter substrate-binding protein [Lachnospiraceae bacterium]MDY5742655.1 zinc ABC transporter substrate-binding protein [Lachnospiraceae bacterium]